MPRSGPKRTASDPAPAWRATCSWTSWVGNRCSPYQHRDGWQMPLNSRFPFGTRLGTRFVGVLARATTRAPRGALVARSVASPGARGVMSR
jgi:hypothetical protein